MTDEKSQKVVKQNSKKKETYGSIKICKST